MYETSKTNLDNVLQKIRMNNFPFIMLIIILIIIILVVTIRDYILFSRKEGYTLPSNIPIPPTNNPSPPSNIPLPPSNNPSPPSNIPIPPGTIPPGTIPPGTIPPGTIPPGTIPPGTIPPGTIPPGTIPPGTIPPGTIPGNVGDYWNKYKNYYNDFNKLNNVFNEFEKLKNLNIKNKINDTFNNVKTDIKNEMVNVLNNQTNKIKSGISNIKLSIPTIKDTRIINAIIVVSFILIILVLSLVFLPNLSDFKKLLNQMSNVSFVILYTIFIILFFRLLPTNIMDNNAYYIVPITIIIATILFFFSLRSNYVENFNINYERIKMIILYFCFITLCITYYSVNPGEYITKNLNSSLILMTLLFAVFGFLYLIVLLTLPNINKGLNNSNILEKVSFFSKYGSIGFILFLIITSIIIATYPGGFFKNKTSSTIILLLLFVVSIIWGSLLVTDKFSSDNVNVKNNLFNENISFIQKTMISLLGLSLSGIIIAYIVYNIQHLSGRSGIMSFILSIFLIISILILIYKTIFVKLPSNNANKGKNAFFNLIFNLIFYIPCLFSGVFDSIMKMFLNEYNSATIGNVLILIITLILFLLYLFFPKIQHFINLQGGKQLIENPVNTNTQQTLANYIQLNENDNLNYQYGISFWLFIDSNGPNTNPSYNQFTSIMNYGGKPNILYKADTNTLMITMEQKDLKIKGKNNLLEFDDNGNRIIYTNTNVLLQKWNHFAINFNGGTLDIFLNGKLVKSSIEVIPYIKLDALTIGNDVGVNGGICNVVYFKKPLTITNIYFIYNNLKNKNPPVFTKTFNI
jgi:hypothetical protein